MSKKALAILPSGGEEMEFVTTVDILRRGGVVVDTCGLDGTNPVTCTNKIVIVPDIDIATAAKNSYDAIILPGGKGGAKSMSESKALGDLLKKYEKDGKIVAAICAAPTALLAHSIGLGKKITSNPSVKSTLIDHYQHDETSRVVQDGNLITSQGPGTAAEYGFKLLEVLVGKDKSMEVSKHMLVK